ncbi:MAG TPA: prepilin-type N-terminal cleavage/methylation domain-containing protein [Firmicutes bacterium]|nr:prepilin-type N-terminal cleavage/methylation domain-containing protein [Bacillota bacterium]
MKNRRAISLLASEKGFTLVELVVVLAVIGIMVAVAYPTYTNTRIRAYTAEAKAILQELRVDAWDYYLQKGSFNGFTIVGNHNTENWTFTATVAQDYKSVTLTATGVADKIVKNKTVTLQVKDDGTAVLTEQ